MRSMSSPEALGLKPVMGTMDMLSMPPAMTMSL